MRPQEWTADLHVDRICEQDGALLAGAIDSCGAPGRGFFPWSHAVGLHACASSFSALFSPGPDRWCAVQKFKPQFRRLLFIDRRIREGRFPNCAGLAAEWEVSRKTMQRDMDYLKYEMGAPVEYDPVRHGYYYTEADYRLPALNMSESDLFAICVAERALRQFRNTPVHGKLLSVFNRIVSSLPERVTVDPAWIDSRISFSSEPAPRIDADVWNGLAHALRDNRRVRLRYRAPRKRPSERDVDPYHLVGHRGEWYLIAWCHRQRSIRTFAVSRIESLALCDERFEVPARYDGQDMIGEHFGIIWGERVYGVRIRFAPEVAPYIREREWHRDQVLRESRDGSLTLSFRTRHLNEVKDWVLSWGGNARVLAPKKLADKVKTDLRAALASYR